MEIRAIFFPGPLTPKIANYNLEEWGILLGYVLRKIMDLVASEICILKYSKVYLVINCVLQVKNL